MKLKGLTIDEKGNFTFGKKKLFSLFSEPLFPEIFLTKEEAIERGFKIPKEKLNQSKIKLFYVKVEGRRVPITLLNK